MMHAPYDSGVVCEDASEIKEGADTTVHFFDFKFLWLQRLHQLLSFIIVGSINENKKNQYVA